MKTATARPPHVLCCGSVKAIASPNGSPQHNWAGGKVPSRCRKVGFAETTLEKAVPARMKSGIAVFRPHARMTAWREFGRSRTACVRSSDGVLGKTRRIDECANGACRVIHIPLFLHRAVTGLPCVLQPQNPPQ